MPKRFYVELSQEQRSELEKVCKSHPKPYMRERASALLKVAEGYSMNWVAEKGLLKRHEPETIKDWIKRYLEKGVVGWKIQSGRGRKPVFSPTRSSRSSKGA